jgi:hypothetical protein
MFPKLQMIDPSSPVYINVNGKYILIDYGAVYGVEDDSSKSFIWYRGSMYKTRGENPLGGYNSTEDIIAAFD